MKDVWRAGNDIELLINGEAFFPRVFDSIRKARREVLIETFIIREDEVGKALQQTLMYVARRGVHVEITIDAYGGNEASAEFFEAMADAGVHVHLFEPTRHFYTFRLNVFRRLHRKLVVVPRGEEGAFLAPHALTALGLMATLAGCGASAGRGYRAGHRRNGIHPLTRQELPQRHVALQQKIRSAAPATEPAIGPRWPASGGCRSPSSRADASSSPTTPGSTSRS